MSLNIKDPEAHKLAQQLATETGETMTSAVIQAIRDRLEAVRRRRIGRTHYARYARTMPARAQRVQEVRELFCLRACHQLPFHQDYWITIVTVTDAILC